MSYRNKNTLGLGQPGYAAERYIPTNLGQASYAAERYIPVSLGQPGYAAEKYLPVSLGQPGYAAERYIPTNLGKAPYAEERYIPVSLGQPGYAAERYIPTNLGQANYAAERYIPVSLGQPGYAAERYIPMSGLGQAKGGDSTAKGGDSTAKGGSGPDNTARDVRMAADIGGSLVRGFIGAPATPPPVAETTAMVEPPPSSGSDLYWPLVIGGGLILVGGIGYFALKGKKSAPTANKRKRGSKRVSKNGYGRSRYGSSYSGDPRWMTARYDGTDDQGNRVRKGDEVLYWPSTKKMMTGAKADAAWRDFLSAKGDEEGMPFARNSRKRVSRR